VVRVYLISSAQNLRSGEQWLSFIVFVGVMLIGTAALSLGLVIFMTDGECHANRAQNGCLATFNVAQIYSALVMIGIDCILYAFFCCKWYNIISLVKEAPDGRQEVTQFIQSFVVQFILTIIALSSCSIDGVVHLWYGGDPQFYHITMIIFLLDVSVISSCNFGMLPEHQTLIGKIVCFLGARKKKNAATTTKENGSTTSKSEMGYNADNESTTLFMSDTPNDTTKHEEKQKSLSLARNDRNVMPHKEITMYSVTTKNEKTITSYYGLDSHSTPYL